MLLSMLFYIFRREKIASDLDKERIKKFGANANKDFSGPTDAADARSPFFDDQLVHMSGLEVSEQTSVSP